MTFFTDSLQQYMSNVKKATGLMLVWKDAHPERSKTLPRTFVEHRNTYCLHIKTDRNHMSTCQKTDDLEPDFWTTRKNTTIKRTCPFGITELLVPINKEETYQGYFFVGPFRGDKNTNSLCNDMPTYNAKLATALANQTQQFMDLLLANWKSEINAAENKDDQFRKDFLGYIDKHLHAQLRAYEVAEALGFSNSRFVHKCKEAMGKGYSDILREKLVHRASYLLTQGKLSVLEIALSLGYQNQNYFATVFKQLKGLTPMTYRQGHQKPLP